ncbi:MAG: SdhA [Legionella sp.]|uniref:SdhA n=1 Tax=Legionella sp. TaxID=459 RepID=UPI00284D6FA7|nr:SdhA [Legionella sp.]
MIIIEEKLRVIESFKRNMLSKHVERVYAQIFGALNSQHVSPQIRPYFAQERINTTGVPFTDFELEPDNITQIKKLINALYYARLSFIDLEHLDIRDLRKATPNVQLLLSNTIETTYEASYLATHLDVDLKEMFRDELDFILPHLAQVQQLAEKNAQATKDAIQPYPIAKTVGEATGKTVDQLRPLGGDVDYNFLTEFSALLPSYINQLTEKIESYSSEIRQNEPKLNQKKLDEIQNAALHLLNDIENLKGNKILVSLKFLNYIHILRNLITLVMSTLEQVGELSEFSQDVVCGKLSQIKYDVLPKLFGLVDKIEVNCMLNPGTLSAPLMANAQKLYEALVYLPKKAIDFKTRGEELLQIEDSRFIELRLELAYKRIDTANKTLYKTKQAQDAIDAFFDELEKAEHQNLSLHQLPEPVREQLISHYKIFKPYVERLDLDLNDQMSAGLLGPKAWSSYTTRSAWASYISRPWSFITRALDPDHVSFILPKRAALSALINKNEATQLFHIRLNRDLIDSVYKNAQLALYPYNRQTNVYTLDETIPLGIKQDEAPLTIEKTQLLTLRKNFISFNKLIKRATREDQTHLTLNQLSNETKIRLRNLYNKLSPYLPYLTTHKEDLQKFEQYLAAILANRIVDTKDTPTIVDATFLMQSCATALSTIQTTWPTTDDSYYDLQQTKFLDEGAAAAFLEQESKKLKFEKSDSTQHTLLRNPEQLTADQTLELCEWYRNKHNKFQVARQAYNDFMKLLQIHSSQEKCPNAQAPLLPYDGTSDSIYNIDETNLQNTQTNALTPNPEQLTADEAIELYAFYRNKYNNFQAARQAYIEFSKILQEHSLHENIYDLRQLDGALKEQCRNLYAVFQPYFAASSTLRPNEMLNLDHILVDLLSNNPVVVTDLPVAGLFKDAEKHFVLIEKTWRQKKQQFMRLAQEKTATETEFLDLLRAHNIKGSAQNIDALNDQVKTQCRNLYNVFQAYVVCAAPEASKKSILTFDKFLADALSKKKIAAATIPAVDFFEVLDEHFETYFASVSMDWHHKNQQYISIAQEKLVKENEAASLSLNLKQGERAYRLLKDTNISKGIAEFRSALYGIQALFNEAMRKQLVPKAKGVPYPEMEDPYQQLAQSMQVRAIKDIYNCLFHIEGIAHELENLNDYNLHRPYSAIGEESMAKLWKWNYVSTLLQAYGHINEIIKLSERLTTDPHYSFITRELVSKAQNLYAVIQGHSFAYQTAPEQIPVPGTVQQNSVWFALNAFYIGPNHIRSLKNKNYQSTEELNTLYKNAKQATLTIEAMIKNSHSYFKLFLQSPQMLLLYRELMQKLNEFTTTAHDAALNNIDKIRPGIFTPMLLEADHWETKLGLAPGSLSEPLRRITNEFYKGFLEALDLPSEVHVALICDKKPLEERTNILDKKITKAQKNIERVKEEHADLETLYMYVQEYKRYAHPDLMSTLQPISVHPFTFEECVKGLQDQYKKNLPVLAQFRDTKKVSIDVSTYEDQHLLDKVCSEPLNAYDPEFTEIESWITASYHYVLGLLSTYEMRLQTAKEQLAQLKGIDKVQAKENQDFVHEYTTKTFDRHLKKLCNRHIGLQYTDQEYRKELRKELLTFKAQIITQAKTVKDISFSIEKQLQEKIGEFERKHYEEYAQLDRVRVVLAQIKGYLSDATKKKNEQQVSSVQKPQSKLKDPLTEKSELINDLYEIATNAQDDADEPMSVNADAEPAATVQENVAHGPVPKAHSERIKKPVKMTEDEPASLSIKKRFEKIKTLVKQPRFESVLLAPNRHMDTLSYAYLKACFLSLLETLNLYTSTRKRFLENMNEAVDKPQKLDTALIVRFGLFIPPTQPPVSEALAEAAETTIVALQ